MSSSHNNHSSSAAVSSSVSLACVQSLCDIMRELPLPSPASCAPSHTLESTALTVTRRYDTRDTSLAHQLQALLLSARQQMNDTGLVFDNHYNNGVECSPTVAVSPEPPSPLVQHLTRAGVFGTAAHNACNGHESPFGQSSHVLNTTVANNTTNNASAHQHPLCPQPQQQQTSLTTHSDTDSELNGLKASWTGLAMDEQHSLADYIVDDDDTECFAQQDSTSSTVNTSTQPNDDTEDVTSYSSLGDRVKSRRRVESLAVTSHAPTTNNEQNNKRMSPQKNKKTAEVLESSASASTASMDTCRALLECKPLSVVVTPITIAHTTPTTTTSSHKLSKSSHSGHSKTSSHRQSSSHHNASHDVLTQFESLLDELLLSDGNNDDMESDDDMDDDDARNRRQRRQQNMFGVTFESEHLSRLVSLTSKLKRQSKTHLARAGKLCAFLVAVTQQLNVWLARLKHNDEDSDDGDEQHWSACCDLCLIALNVFTSPDVSSRVFVEECVEGVVAFVAHAVSQQTAAKRLATRLSELIALLVQLLQARPSGALTDSLVLAITRIGMTAFHTQLDARANSTELQLRAVSCITTVFQSYATHRHSILEELLLSLARVPNAKKRNFDDGFSMQLSMFSALLLRLAHCLYDSCPSNDNTSTQTRDTLERQQNASLRVMSSFLNSLMQRSLSQSSSATASAHECDFRALFDALVNDVMRVLHRPNWPSALLVAEIVAKLLISNLSPNAKTVSLNLRLGSLDFLAVIASRFAQLLATRDAMCDDIRATLKTMRRASHKSEQNDDNEDEEYDDKPMEIDELIATSGGEERVKRLDICWKTLVSFCNSKKLFREKTCFAALWLKNVDSISTRAGDRFVRRLNARVSREMDDEVVDVKSATLVVQYIDAVLFPCVNRLFDASISHVTASLSSSTNTTQRSRAMKALSAILSACPLQKSLQLLARADLQIAMRSALLDASTSVREATIDLIGRFVLGGGDTTLVEQYCDLIGERILDAGVSVRKRVIKILREICLQFPEFEKNGELCSRIVKRVNDECEPIRRLVADTCRDLWFSNQSNNKDAARPRARSLLHVVSVMMRENRLEALQTLFTETLNKSADARRSASLLVSVIVTEMLVGSDTADTNADDAKQRLVAAMTTVYMLARDFPSLVSRHVESLQSLLSVSCENRLDVVFVVHVVNTLERVLNTDSSAQSESQPILSESLLTRIETDLTKNVLVANALVLSASVRCLATLIHAHTNNVQLAKDLFARFTSILVGARALATPLSPALKPKILRAIYTCGLFAKHFVFIHDLASRETVVDTLVQLCDSSRDPEIRLKSLISLGFVIESDARVALRARVVQIYFRFLTGSVVSLTSMDDTCATTEALFCVQTLNNIRNYFSGIVLNDEKRIIEWSRESLKCMTSSASGDQDDSIQSQIVQTFLAPILDASLSPSPLVRRVASQLVHVIHSGGHVHPLQLVPHLVAMTTDDDSSIRTRAEHVINEIERKFQGFVAMKARAGLLLSARLCRTLSARGFRVELSGERDVCARLASLYHVIGHKSRPARRAFLNMLLRYFEVEETTMSSMSASSMSSTSEPWLEPWTSTSRADEFEFVLENLLFLRFTVFDEPLFVLSQLELTSSVNSSHANALFCELLGVSEQDDDEDDNNDDENDTDRQQKSSKKSEVRAEEGMDSECQSSHVSPSVSMLDSIGRVRELLRTLTTIYCVALTRRLLRELYSLSDAKCGEYSPNENAKVWDKPIHRRNIDVTRVDSLVCVQKPNIDFNNLQQMQQYIDSIETNGQSVTDQTNIEQREQQLRRELMQEWTRFKSSCLTTNGVPFDSQFEKNLVQLFKVPKVSATSTTTTTTTTTTQLNDSSLSDSETQKLLESIRLTSCHVSLVDISTQMTTTTPEKRTSKKRGRRHSRRHSQQQQQPSSPSSSVSSYGGSPQPQPQPQQQSLIETNIENI